MAASITVTVDPDAEIAPYQQILEQICSAIQRGDLKSGATLPTVRQLAGDLNVAPNTVARAYADLQDAGWLVSDGRRGTRVTEDVPTADKRVRKSVLRERVSAFIASMKARGYSRSEILSELNRTT
ncbi:MAG TPA: GntR family transcriptional regulator [Candidatus Rubrimentiphilum sp.]|nr:GntR family transcriptional regulator [Candidatus Rubrimentiphilum sp.]